MIKPIGLLWLLLLAGTCCAQNNYRNYYDYINLAEKKMLQSRFDAADSCFKAAFATSPKQGYNLDYLTAAFNAAKRNDTLAIDTYLRGFAQRGGNYHMLKNKVSQNRWMEEHAPAMLTYLSASHRAALRKELDHAYRAYAVTVNPGLIKKIKRMYRNDQRYARGFLVGLLPAKKQDRIMEKTDHKHAQQLLAICKIYGWPGFDLLGEYREYGKYRLEKIDVLLRHFSHDDLELLKPYILNSIRGLNYYPSILAGCIDYNEVKQPVYNEKQGVYEIRQRYGTLSQTENGVSTLIPFGKPAELSVRRKELFLCDIEDYCLIRRIDRMPSTECITIEAQHPKK